MNYGICVNIAVMNLTGVRHLAIAPIVVDRSGQQDRTPKLKN